MEHVLPHDANTRKFLLAGKCYVTLEKVIDGTRCTYRVQQKVTDHTFTDPDAYDAFVTGKDARVTDGDPDELGITPGAKVYVQERHPFWFVSLVKGAIGDTKPRYLGIIDAKGFRTTKATMKNKSATADNINLFGDTLRSLDGGASIAHAVRIWHTGRCGRCAKALSVPTSIATGLGPICAAQMGVSMKDVSPSLIEKIAALMEQEKGGVA